MRNLALPSRRARTSCSVLALATVMLVGPTPALAQSFLGSGSFATNGGGVAGITTPTSTTTTITVNPGQSVIDWTPTDNAIGGGNIAFQLSGTTATFTGASNFAVLNRINQADMNRAISLNGTINSLVGGVQGGSLYFYSPGGFLLGGSSLINVGSLVLSASPLTLDGSGNFIIGANNQVIFGQAPRATAGIVTNSGSAINANAADAYVAMVAPRVQHGGTITVDGSAALVAAEAATINFSPDGLFDIQVTTGTTDTTGVSTTGTISGAASTGAADIHRAYLVAVPKNSALTMLIGAGSNLGFNVAGAANVVGNTVILSAGRDISGGSIGAYSAGSIAGTLANLQINDSNFRSAVMGEATGFAHVSAFAPMHFYSDANIHADGEIWFSTQAAAGTLDVDGSLNLSTERYGSDGQSVATSKIDLYNVNGGGRITVNGATTINTNAHGGWSGTSGTPGGDATAGNVGVNASSGGTVELLGGLTVSANGYAGSAFAAGVNGGKGTGGHVSLYTIGDNDHLTVTGATNLTANGYGGSGNGGECFICDGAGGDGVGGVIQISPNDSTTTGSVMTFNGNLTASANGQGGTAVTGLAGKGLGGTAILLSANLSTLAVNGSLSLQALGQGGYHLVGTGGEGRGGFAYISSFGTATTGQITITGNADLNAGGTGGGSGGTGTVAGQGTGGTAYIRAARDTVSITGNANVNAYGIGGNAAAGTGGTGLGGIAYLQSDTALTIGGLATLSTDGTGGTGNSGGLGNGGTTSVFTNLAGASLTVGGVNATARGFGGDATTNLGGAGSGGNVQLYYSNGTTLTVNGDVTLRGVGRGGASVSGNGAAGTGGYVNFGSKYLATGGGSLTVNGNVELFVQGFGGATSAAGATGGSGIGGTADGDVYTGTETVTGSLVGGTTGFGGDAVNGTGGSGYGGQGWVDALGGSVTLGSYEMYANGRAGNGLTGGYGKGGKTYLLSESALRVLNGVIVMSSGFGGLGTGGNGGNALGGTADVRVTGGTLRIDGDTSIRATGRGGESDAAGFASGNGTGGSVYFRALNAGTLTLNAPLFMNASGFGGDVGGNGVDAGNGTGGNVYLEANGANAAVNLLFDATLNANGFGGSPLSCECSITVGKGGNGIGGEVHVRAFGGTGTSLYFGGNLSLNANGIGSAGSLGVGGNGVGGHAGVQIGGGGLLTVDGSVNVNAWAVGGDQWNGGSAGNGTGGTAELITVNGAASTIHISGNAALNSSGTAGSTTGAAGGHGGNGTGGLSQIFGHDFGHIDITGSAFLESNGTGGNAYQGIGGNGLGNIAQIVALEGSSIAIGGSAHVDAKGSGGSGHLGGSGTGGGDPNEATFQPGAQIFARNGTLTIAGDSFVDVSGVGGNGGASNVAGGVGGLGGAGTGGFARVQSQNSDGGPSSIVVHNITIGAGGTGGDGGVGGNGNTGGIGGGGGAGIGGFVTVAGAAGNGSLTAGNVLASATASGGRGGNGGNGDGLAGGNGGVGGNARGGWATVGTISGLNQATASNLGSGHYGAVTINSSAVGGNGGNGNFGATPGNGGNGGNAFNGYAFLLSRGSLVTVASATLMANATGGNAGFGYNNGFGSSGVIGVAGNATVGGDGGIAVIATGRYLIPTQRGTLNAGAITGTAIATAGIGIPNGSVSALGGNQVTFFNADGNIGSLNFQVGVGSNSFGGSISGVDSISIRNGNVDVKNGFSFVTDGNLSLFADNGDMHADNITLHAADFVPDTINVTPGIAGTFYARLFDIATSNNFLTTANLDSTETLTINAPGLINAHNFTVGGDLNLFAQGGGIAANNLSVIGAINLGALGAINLNIVQAGFFHAEAGTFFTSSDITSDSNIQIFAGDDVTLGDLVAGATADINSNKAIRINSGGSVLVGNILAAGGIDITATNAVTGGNVTSGDAVFTDAGGAVHYGNISAGLVNPQPPTGPFSVGMTSGTSITVGNVDASRSVAFLTPGTLTTGNIVTGADLIGLVHGNISIGDIDAGGRVYLADFSMFTDAGGVLGADNNINPEVIFGATPVATGGSIAINGPVTAGKFVAAAGTFFDAGDITSVHNIYIDAGTNISLGDLVAGLSDNVIDGHVIRLTAGGSIDLGNAIAAGRITFKAGGTIDGGDMTSGDMVDAEADGAIVLGDISSGLVNPQPATPGDVSVAITSKTSIQVGNIDSAGTVGMVTLGALNAGAVNAAGDLIALAGGNMTLGALDIGGRVLLSNPSLFINAQDVNGDVSAEVILNSPIVPSGGSITTGTISAGSLQAAAGTTLNVGAINAGGRVALSSGGAMQTQNITTGSSLNLTSGGAINGGNYIANTLVRVFGVGAVNVGNITIIHPSLGAKPIGTAALSLIPVGSPIEVFGSSIVTGNLLTDGYVGLYTPGTMSVGTIGAGTDVIALAGSDASFGAITTPGRFILGGYSMFAGLGSGVSFDPSLVFGLTKTKTGGSATFGGASSVGSFQAYVGGAATLQSLTTSSSALIDALGLFTLNGTLNGNSRIISNDIEIGSGGAVNTGTLQLVSLNATQTVVGDGVAGGGYQLSDAEFDRIHTPLSVVADVSYGAAAKMLIGDLTATVSGISQTGYDYLFATLNGNSSTSVGSIKVLGNVTFTGLSLTDEVVFQTNLFELDAATGSVNLFGSGTTLGGVLGLYAPKVWVASGAILTKLEANARYSGYIAELNAPAAVQRPEGVLRAATFDIDAGAEDFQSFLVQNTGTKEIPAGFLTNADGIGDNGGSSDPPGSIDLVINGQLITPQGTLTGIAVRDLLVAGLGTTRFVAGSTINGCPLTGSCSVAPPSFNTVTSSEVQLAGSDGLGDGLFGNEPDIDDGQSGDDGDLSSPIEAPVPLFDSRPLDTSDDVNDPASGAGNPSLYGNPDEDDQSDAQKKAKKVKKGDGK